ncbi:hypothetical protein [Promicromonospora iranensis]|uniref:Uncharacterized protein n=1 Tax=Promicromonospora iranensis TaxID=1105144 RepID=A0ABU2CVT6_9MICO|nr:hypothetical protein [Promicromonospora iranensis]MDR7385247.1 hypothetical protein [Promicromonospora iranensis]
MSNENVPVLLTGPMCMAMPVGTAVELAEPRHGVWHAKTSELTWAFFWRERPTPEQIWQAVDERTNNLSPYPSGMAYVYEPPAKPDATPAPLDPSKVKAGDTVTVEVIRLHGPRYSLSGEVYRVDTSGPLWVGPVCITAPDEDIVRVRLTDHQPAPEPEPEWALDTLADITNGSTSVRAIRVETPDGNVWQTIPHSSWWSDANVTDVRPLVVIDPADEKFDQDSLAEVARTAYSSAHDVVEWETVANAIRAHLGIEVSR